MAKRTKKTVISNVSENDMQDALTAYAKADARIVKINADLDVQMTELRKKRAEELAQLEAEKEAAFDIVQAWGCENKETLFVKKRSMELTHGTVGFRTGTPKLKTRKGFTWPAITNLLKEFLPAYVRTVEEPAKDKLLADRDNEEVAPLLEKVGVEVVQDETFYIELKKEVN